MAEREQFDAYLAESFSELPANDLGRGDARRMCFYDMGVPPDIIFYVWQASRRAALDEAAKLVDAEAENARREHYYPGVVGAFEECAEAIRALAAGGMNG